MIAPVSRILLRYLAGLLFMHGLADMEMSEALANDADALAVMQWALQWALDNVLLNLPLMVGAMTGAVTEWWYSLARRFGWEK